MASNDDTPVVVSESKVEPKKTPPIMTNFNYSEIDALGNPDINNKTRTVIRSIRQRNSALQLLHSDLKCQEQGTIPPTLTLHVDLSWKVPKDSLEDRLNNRIKLKQDEIDKLNTAVGELQAELRKELPADLFLRFAEHCRNVDDISKVLGSQAERKYRLRQNRKMNKIRRFEKMKEELAMAATGNSDGGPEDLKSTPAKPSDNVLNEVRGLKDQAVLNAARHVAVLTHKMTTAREQIKSDKECQERGDLPDDLLRRSRRAGLMEHRADDKWVPTALTKSKAGEIPMSVQELETINGENKDDELLESGAEPEGSNEVAKKALREFCLKECINVKEREIVELNGMLGECLNQLVKKLHVDTFRRYCEHYGVAASDYNIDLELLEAEERVRAEERAKAEEKVRAEARAKAEEKRRAEEKAREEERIIAEQKAQEEEAARLARESIPSLMSISINIQDLPALRNKRSASGSVPRSRILENDDDDDDVPRRTLRNGSYGDTDHGQKRQRMHSDTRVEGNARDTFRRQPAWENEPQPVSGIRPIKKRGEWEPNARQEWGDTIKDKQSRSGLQQSYPKNKSYSQSYDGSLASRDGSSVASHPTPLYSRLSNMRNTSGQRERGYGETGLNAKNAQNLTKMTNPANSNPTASIWDPTFFNPSRPVHNILKPSTFGLEKAVPTLDSTLPLWSRRTNVIDLPQPQHKNFGNFSTSQQALQRGQRPTPMTLGHVDSGLPEDGMQSELRMIGAISSLNTKLGTIQKSPMLPEQSIDDFLGRQQFERGTDAFSSRSRTVGSEDKAHDYAYDERPPRSEGRTREYAYRERPSHSEGRTREYSDRERPPRSEGRTRGSADQGRRPHSEGRARDYSDALLLEQVPNEYFHSPHHERGSGNYSERQIREHVTGAPMEIDDDSLYPLSSKRGKYSDFRAQQN